MQVKLDFSKEPPKTESKSDRLRSFCESPNHVLCSSHNQVYISIFTSSICLGSEMEQIGPIWGERIQLSH